MSSLYSAILALLRVRHPCTRRNEYVSPRMGRRPVAPLAAFWRPKAVAVDPFGTLSWHNRSLPGMTFLLFTREVVSVGGWLDFGASFFYHHMAIGFRLPCATLAQLVEQYFRKVEVPGSIPGSGSIVMTFKKPRCWRGFLVSQHFIVPG